MADNFSRYFIPFSFNDLACQFLTKCNPLYIEVKKDVQINICHIDWGRVFSIVGKGFEISGQIFTPVSVSDFKASNL